MLFNLISPIYGLFFNYQVNFYKEVINKVKDEIDIREYKKILDLGCGIGSLSYVLEGLGMEVVGVDTSSGMLKQARKKLQGSKVELIKVKPGESLPFQDNTFDLAISSYVLHGLRPDERERVYKDLCRVTKSKVILHDYNRERSIKTNIIEFLENGDYFNFIKVVNTEMKKHFKNVKTINVAKRADWYIGEGCNTYDS